MFGFASVLFCFKNCYSNLNFTQKSWRRKIEWDQMNKVLVFKGTRPTLTERISRRLERASLALFGPCTIFTWVRGQTIKKPREWVEMACLSNKRKTVNSHENWSGSPSAWMKSKVFDWPVYLCVRFCVFDFHSCFWRFTAHESRIYLQGVSLVFVWFSRCNRIEFPFQTQHHSFALRLIFEIELSPYQNPSQMIHWQAKWNM